MTPTARRPHVGAMVAAFPQASTAGTIRQRMLSPSTRKWLGSHHHLHRRRTHTLAMRCTHRCKAGILPRRTVPQHSRAVAGTAAQTTTAGSSRCLVGAMVGTGNTLHPAGAGRVRGHHTAAGDPARPAAHAGMTTQGNAATAMRMAAEGAGAVIVVAKATTGGDLVATRLKALVVAVAVAVAVRIRRWLHLQLSHSSTCPRTAGFHQVAEDAASPPNLPAR